jgi:cysteine-rich repeat protein
MRLGQIFQRPRIVAAAPVLALLVLAAAPSHAATVTKASDVCPDNADPCVVTSVMDIPVGVCTDNPLATCTTNTDCVMPATCNRSPTILDFGLRDVVVSGGGQFNFGAASGSILAGDFSATTTNPAIDAAGILNGETDSGTVRLYARRKCSSGVSPPNCVSDGDCDLSTCDTRCTLRRTELCSANADCNKGTCTAIVAGKKRCSGNTNISCSTDANCNFGTCPTQLTCSKVVTTARNCSTNSDCIFGACSVGTASITMNGPIVGNSSSPAFLDIRAADNVSILKSVNLAGTTAESDGGELYVDATFGTATLSGKVTATSGGFGFGGDVSIYAGIDVVVNEEVDVTGGDSGGGFVDFDAERDLTVTRSIFANSSAGAGDGGEILFAAGRDFLLSGISAANKSSLETTGHTDLTNFAGDGGTQDITAERNLTLNVNTRLIANGPVPDATAGDVTIDAGQDVSLDGDITARATGANGTGGYLDVASDGKITVSSTGTIALTGGAGDAGDLSAFSTGDLSFAGLADLSASNGGGNGAVALYSSRNATVSGTVNMTTGDGTVDVSACYVTLTGTGKLDLNLTEGVNRIEADEQIRLNTGSLVKTGPLGENQLRYRTAAKPPIINGTVTPAPELILDESLRGCIICGNSLLDGRETCEDGNTVNGDGCNSNCQNEACVAQTAPKKVCTTNADCGTPGSGYTCVGMVSETRYCETWSICEDSDFCTVDTCNDGQDTCVHTPKNCNDQVPCTVDSCNGATGSCSNQVNNAACDDGNACTDDICDAQTGCANTANTLACDDGVECTTGDTCVNKVCVGTPGEGCGFCGDGTTNGAEDCDDGNTTFVAGQYCLGNCEYTPCGKPTGTAGAPKSSDALFALRAGVGTVDCSLCVCDVNNSGMVTASSAQRILRLAVGQAVVLNCPTGCTE